MRYLFIFTLLLLVLIVLCEAQRAARRRNQQNRQVGAASGNRRGGNQRRGNQRRGQRGRGRPGRRRGGGGSRRRGCKRPLRSSFQPLIGNGTCEEIRVPMCRGLIGYTHTQLPNIFGHTNQSKIYTELEREWPWMDDHACSINYRLVACGIHLPKCTNGSPNLEMPCRETCFRAKRACTRRMKSRGSDWPKDFICGKKGRLKRKCDGGCLPPKPERPPMQLYITCQRNTMALCQNMPVEQGVLPNMFLQYNISEVEAEMAQFEPLIRSNCSQYLRFFLCGLYMPFCDRPEGLTPFALPCREFCQTVFSECSSTYENLYGLPWSSKFQCHRMPSRTDRVEPPHQPIRCLMPNAS